MKNIYTVLLLSLLSLMINLTFGQRMNGRIKSYKDSYYSLHEVFGKIKKGPKLNDSVFHDQVVSFDQSGNISQSIEYNSDGTVNSRFIGKCDSGDNNIESMFVRFDPDIKIDRKPFIINSVKYPSGEMCELTYKNDLNGRPVEETIFDLMGRVLFTVNIRRDEQGNVLENNSSDGSVDHY